VINSHAKNRRQRRLIRTPRLVRAFLSGVAVLVLVAGGVFVASEAANAAGTTITVSSSATTITSGTAVTYTLTASCSTTGGCTGSTVTFPTTTITGDGIVTDFASWVKNVTCPTMTAASGQVSFAYGTIATGTQQCTFTVKPPEYTTLNGAQATVTPTLASSGSPSSTATPVTLTVTAGHDDSLTESAPSTALAGGSFSFSIVFSCGTGNRYVGDLGLSALDIEEQLPANFSFTGYTPRNPLPGTFTTPAAGSSGGTFSYTDNGGACADPPLDISNAIVITVTGTATANGDPDTVGDTACTAATSNFTYIDGTTASSPAPQACSTVVSVATSASKTVTGGTIPNAGQYAFGGVTYPYTYPGNWDGAADSVYDLGVTTTTATVDAGISYQISDPLPCLDNVAANVYSSNAVGDACAHPGFVPTGLTVASGFTPTASDVITLLYADGTTGTVPYVVGTGWTIPTSPAVAEIDLPPFVEEGANTLAAMDFHLKGYAAASVPPNSLLTNTMTSVPSPSGEPASTFGITNNHSASLIVADPASPSGTVVYPSITAKSTGTCVESVALDSTSNSLLTDQVEIASAPSQAIYVDYLAPKNAAGVTGTTQTFTLKGASNGQTYTGAATTTTTTADYNGTGRTLYQWAIPAGLAQVPGTYQIRQVAPLTVNLEAGCAGTYQNDITVGYGTAITKCVWDNGGSSSAQDAPMAPKDNNDLDTNGSPIAGNYCGYSSPLVVTPVNPGFTVDKTVQGNLDAAPVSSGGIGDISPTGGTATYDLTFDNTGQSNLHDPVMYDLLPRVGDTEASSTTARGSQFPVTVTSLGTLPTGVTVWYSTAVDPCRPEVLATNPGCVDDWSTTAPSPLSATTALKIGYAGTIGVSDSFTVPYSVSTAAAAAGQIAWNSVGTNVYAGDNLLGAAESSVTGLEAAGGEPSITKSADVASYSSNGTSIGYTYTVTNNAAVPLTDVGVTDTLTDAASGDVAPTVTCESLSTPAGVCSGATTTLAPGQVATFTATYPVNQGDLDHGLIKDTATVTGQPPTGGALSNTSNEVTVTAVASNLLTLQQSTTTPSVSAVGDPAVFDFTVTNGGNQTVHGLAINADTVSGVTCAATVLAPGASTTCEATYAATQADIDAGSITDTASASAVDPAGTTVSSPSEPVTVPAVQNPGLTVDETASPSSVGAVGDVVTFSFRVANSGNVTLNGVSVVEGAFTGSDPFGTISCPLTTLAPGQTMTCTVTDYAVTQTDLDNGSIENTVTATSTAPGGRAVPAPQVSADVPIVQTNELDLTKTADVQTVTAAGQKIGYSFHITNAGNAAVTGIAVQETSFSGSGSLSAVTCPATDLAPGADMTCTASYSVTQADLSTSAITNTAVATGVLPATSVTSDPSTARVAVNPTGGVVLAFTGVYGVGSLIGGGIGLFGFGAVLTVLGLRRRRGNA
jgi:hypothetical protein